MPSLARPPDDCARILIAGSNRQFCRELRASIEAHEDLEVVGIAEKGEEAIELAERLSPSLVLMDVAMPGLDGIEAARRIGELSESPPVVLMTSDNDEINHRAVGVGAAAYLRKSSDLASLLDFVVEFVAVSPRSSEEASKRQRRAAR